MLMLSPPIKDALAAKTNKSRRIQLSAKRFGRVGHQTASFLLMLMGFCGRSDPFWGIKNITGSSGWLLGRFQLPGDPDGASGPVQRTDGWILIRIRRFCVSGRVDRYVSAAAFLRMRNDKTKRPR